MEIKHVDQKNKNLKGNQNIYWKNRQEISNIGCFHRVERCARNTEEKKTKKRTLYLMRLFWFLIWGFLSQWQGLNPGLLAWQVSALTTELHLQYFEAGLINCQDGLQLSYSCLSLMNSRNYRYTPPHPATFFCSEPCKHITYPKNKCSLDHSFKMTPHSANYQESLAILKMTKKN